MLEITPDVAEAMVKFALGDSWGCYAYYPTNQDCVLVAIYRKWVGPRGLRFNAQFAIYPFDTPNRIAQRVDEAAATVTRDALKKWEWVPSGKEWGGEWVCRD